ncbi:MAG: hypothetical protein N2257_01180 [Thermodesulfovibrionales bacterium]|nr:hypothetical protein [Thermodesulfovibrionales bacterium]
MNSIECCAICAWRETCQKKFSLSGSSLHCPEFVRDISIKILLSEEDKVKKPKELEEENNGNP